MGCHQSKSLRCTRCGYKFLNSEDIIHHLEEEHQIKHLTCPNCDLVGFKDITHLLEHLKQSHGKSFSNEENPLSNYSCPKCNLKDFKDVAAILNHFENVHLNPKHSMVMVKPAEKETVPAVEYTEIKYSNAKPVKSTLTLPPKLGKKVLPRDGDKVLAMWSSTPWQYFHATIRKFMPDTLRYEIDWDDPDPTGRIVDYYNLALDRSPDPKEISIGSIVLFPQGSYVGGPLGGVYGGMRWHQGKITRIYDELDGSRLFDGCHTKGESDGKWITYRGYSYTFNRLRLEALRIGPNVFDLLDGNNGDNSKVSEDDVDIFFSYTVKDSPKAIKNNETSNVPDSYLELLNNLCDPRDIVNFLKEKGLKIGERIASSSEDLRKTASMMKRAKVFIACISDQYVANEECRMEFQYAKTTLGTPIVPLVVGDGSFEWTMSVVGMLIAGELYIHFKDKTVENNKFNELINALKTHFDKIADVTDAGEDSLQVDGQADVFLSYSWANSFIAKNAKQVDRFFGHEFSDPRLVKNELQKAGLKMWIDIERLRSANAGAGMYEQLTSALKDAKVVVPCISTEYANSPNCRMEFQFAMKSLKKPIVPIVVGKGDDWRTTVVGALVDNNNIQTINFQYIDNRDAFSQTVQLLIDQIGKILDTEETPSVQSRRGDSRAPKIGDHVVCHHVQCAYYMATVVHFNHSTLEYTVNWDDGDPSGRVQPYNQVALDVVPDADDVGVGSIVFFPQGQYSGAEGNNEGGQRYHEGMVTSCRMGGSAKMVSGHHTKGADDGKWITYPSYSYKFEDYPLDIIRVAPSAMEAFLAAN